MRGFDILELDKLGRYESGSLSHRHMLGEEHILISTVAYASGSYLSCQQDLPCYSTRIDVYRVQGHAAMRRLILHNLTNDVCKDLRTVANFAH